ncbi:Multidrug resistance protein MdtC [Frankliniella fusca]|uniref:Multidrug resistance protein MdtC n=1 Tax=Frankliniella fusca TaxID=407009 RepID=A0AAE1LAH1_9NEOP|nr:Multidrug resistance protein MdtC [Frankliniella fusca]
MRQYTWKVQNRADNNEKEMARDAPCLSMNKTTPTAHSTLRHTGKKNITEKPRDQRSGTASSQLTRARAAARRVGTWAEARCRDLLGLFLAFSSRA